MCQVPAPYMAARARRGGLMRARQVPAVARGDRREHAGRREGIGCMIMFMWCCVGISEHYALRFASREVGGALMPLTHRVVCSVR